MRYIYLGSLLSCNVGIVCRKSVQIQVKVDGVCNLRSWRVPVKQAQRVCYYGTGREEPEGTVQVKDAFGDKKGLKGLMLTDTESGADPGTAALPGAWPSAHASSIPLPFLMLICSMQTVPPQDLF